MIVRSHLPWPLRWALVAVMLGFSAAIALWAFEFGRDIAGLDRNAKAELTTLREEVTQLRAEREKSLSIANTADSLLRAERASQAQLVQQIREVEAENLALKRDLGFFERLLPAGAPSAGGLSIRGLQAEAADRGRLRFQLLVMQAGRHPAEFVGRYEISLSGMLDGKPWTYVAPTGPQKLQVKQHVRIEGLIEYPHDAVVKQIQAKVTDLSGNVRVTQLAKI